MCRRNAAISSANGRARDDQFMRGLCPDPAWMILAEAIYEFFDQILKMQFPGRHKSWWFYKVIPVAPHIVLDASCVKKIMASAMNNGLLVGLLHDSLTPLIQVMTRSPSSKSTRVFNRSARLASGSRLPSLICFRT